MRYLSLAILSVALVCCGDSGADGGGSAGAPSQSGNAGGGSSKAFKFSAIPDEAESDNIARFTPVAEYLAGKLGVKVEYVPVKDYSASVQFFKTGDIHAAWFGGLSGVQARLAVDGATAIAQGDKDPTFYSYFIANKSAGLEPSDDFPTAIEGKKFTFGSEGSTSGRLMPEFFIRDATGKAPKDLFAEVGFQKNHPGTLSAVNTGAYDVGALNYAVYDKAAAADKANTVVIWKTPVYADYNFTIAGDLDKTFGQGFTAKLKAAWLAMPTALCQESFTRDKMIPATNADFAGIEATAKELGLAR